MAEKYYNYAPPPEPRITLWRRITSTPLRLWVCLLLNLACAVPLPAMASQASPEGTASLGNWEASIESQIEAAQNEVDAIANNPELSKGIREVAAGLQEVITGVQKVFEEVGTTAESGASGASVYGSYNLADYATGGDNTTINTTGVGWNIYGTFNQGNFTSGGANTIVNNDRVGWSMYGGYNQGDLSRGGNNTVINNAGVGWSMYGSYNEGAAASGGRNTVVNTSGVGWSMYGSYNQGDLSRGGENTVSNSAGVGWSMYGSLNQGDYSGGSNNTITNSSGVGWSIYGSCNTGTGAWGGSNTITSSKGVGWSLYGSYNDGDSSDGGGNLIVNNSGVGWSLYGSLNSGANSSGGSNTIINNDIVGYAILGSWNLGDYSSGGGNSIINTGTVHNDIYGSLNQGSGSSTWGNRIINAGQVDGSIFAGEADDTVIIMAGSTVGGQVDGQAGTDTLVFDSAGVIQGSQYTNFESLTVSGDATTLLGNLLVGEDVDSGLSVGGALQTASLTIAGGTFDVQGDTDFGQDSRFMAALNEPGGAVSLESSGSITINGGELALTVVQPKLYTAPVSWKVIHAGGGLSGSFDTVSLESRTMSVCQSVLADSLQVEVQRTSSYADLAAGRVQGTTALALDSLLPEADGEMADLIAHMDFSYSLEEIRKTLVLLSPALYTGYLSNARNVTRLVDASVRYRQGDAPGLPDKGPAPGGTTVQSWTAWAQPLGQWRSHRGRDDFPGYDAGTCGLALGVDRKLADWLSLGVNTAWADSDISWEDSDTGGRQYGPFAGTSVRMSRAGFHAGASVLAGWLDNRGHREMVLPQGHAIADADFDTLTRQVRLDLGYRLQGGNFRIGPLFSMERIRIRQSGVEESGANALNLNVAGMEQTVSAITLGLDVAGTLQRDSSAIQTGAYLGWRHTIHDSSDSLSAYFRDYPDAPMLLNPPLPQQDALLARVWFSALLSPGINAHFSYAFEHGAGDTAHSLAVSIRMQFF